MLETGTGKQNHGALESHPTSSCKMNLGSPFRFSPILFVTSGGYRQAKPTCLMTLSRGRNLFALQQLTRKWPCSVFPHVRLDLRGLFWVIKFNMRTGCQETAIKDISAESLTLIALCNREIRRKYVLDF